MPNAETPKIAVGPTGGALADALASRLATTHRVVALRAARRRDAMELPRQAEPEPTADDASDPGISRVQCDFFSRLATRQAIDGCETLVFLSGALTESASRSPADLTQGTALDKELNRADNAARAAAHSNVSHVICIQYRPFDDTALPTEQLRSVFRDIDCRLTIVRSSLILGPSTAIFTVLRRALRRFPILFLPHWASNPATVIGTDDLIDEIIRLVNSVPAANTTYDVSGPGTIDLQSLMDEMRATSNSMCRLVETRFELRRSIGWWLSRLSGVDRTDIDAALAAFRSGEDGNQDKSDESLTTPTHANDVVTRACEQSNRPVASRTASSDSDTSSSLAVAPRDQLARTPSQPEPRTARSIQRLPVPTGRSAEWIASEYTEWLPGFFQPFMHVDVDPNQQVRFFVRLLPWPLLELTFDPDASDPGRQLFWITGGLLAADQEHGRLEFREILDGQRVLACVHDFDPRLPWFIYRFTQAIVHAWVMHRFADHLLREDEHASLEPPPDD